MSGSSYSYLWGPVSAFVIIGFFILVLRWAFSGQQRTSLLSRRTRSGRPDEYGLLTEIHAPGSEAEGERIRAVLGLSGIRGTLTTTASGLRVFVFPADAELARDVLRTSGEHPI